jgi:type IV fimbrial biogenesis protein FimT
MSYMPFKRRISGYTIFEIMMALTVIAILASIAVPSFKYVTSSNRIATEVNSLLGDMLFARSEAIKEGQSVTICSSLDGATCSGGPDWRTGWIVFLDTNTNQVVDAGEAVIRSQPAFSGTDTFVASSLTFKAVTFNRLGYGPTNSPTTINVSLHDSTNNPNLIRCLAVNPIGSAVTEKLGVGTPPCA